MNPFKGTWILMMLWLAFLIVAGHIDNYKDIGGIRWFAGILMGAGFMLFYFKIKSKLLSLAMTTGAMVLLLGGITGTLELSNPHNKIALSSFVLGSFVVMVWRAPWRWKKNVVPDGDQL
jgi:hypothetical protein